MNHNLQTLKVVLLALVLAAGIQYASAQAPWRSPTASPPGDNTYAPINVGGAGQIKAGGVTLGSALTDADTVLNLANGKLLLKGSAASPGLVVKANAQGHAVWAPDNTGAGGGIAGIDFYNNYSTGGGYLAKTTLVNARDGLRMYLDPTFLNSPSVGLLPGYQLPQGCSTNQIPKWNGSAWTCQADATGGGATGISEFRAFCVAGDTTTFTGCPVGWTLGGTVDGENSSWCYDAVGTFNGGAVGWRFGGSVDTALCFR